MTQDRRGNSNSRRDKVLKGRSDKTHKLIRVDQDTAIETVVSYHNSERLAQIAGEKRGMNETGRAIYTVEVV